MNSLSKPIFDDLIKGYNCKDIFHPWHPKCSLGILIMARECFKGSMVFFAIMYAITIALKCGKISSSEYKLLCKNYVRSVILGTCHGTLFVGLNCAARQLLGRFQYYAIGLIVPLMFGFDLVIDHPERRNIVHSAFTTMAVESLIRRTLQLTKFPRSRSLETILFMILNGLLMYSLRLNYGERKSLMWFFLPKLRTHQNIGNGRCMNYHDGPCLNDIVLTSAKFFSVALFLSIVRVLWPNIQILKKPMTFLKTLGKGNMALPLFAAGYVGIFKIIGCYYGYLRKTNTPHQSFIAGTLAGSVYWLNPSLPLMASIITLLLKIYGQEMKKREKIPNLPYQILTFSIANGILFHTRVFHPAACPKFVFAMMDVITSGREKVIHGTFAKIVKEYCKKCGIEV